MSSPSLDPTYGAMMIGLLFATFFQGVLSVQAFIYYESFPEDKKKMKALVTWVWCLDALHLVLIAQATYHYLVTNWGNPPALMSSTWELDLHPAVIGLATITCQAFFIRRIWIFSDRNKLLTGALASMCLATLGLDIAVTVQLIQVPVVTEFRALTPEVIAVFSMGAGGDLIIALIMVYYLRRNRSGFDRTNSLISRVIQYTVATGLATSMLAIACLIAYLVSPNTFIFIAIHFSLGRMYTNALLATLNSRQSMRAEFHSSSTNKLNYPARGHRDTPGFTSDSSNPDSQNKAGSVVFAIDSNRNYKGVSPMSTSGMKTAPDDLFNVTSANDGHIELHSIGDKSGFSSEAYHSKF